MAASELAETGAVLGVDVGFSAARATSAVCRLDWTRDRYSWRIERYRAVKPERRAAIGRVAESQRLAAAAFDGPLRGDLQVVGRYRTAERMLTRQLWRRIGKPGQSSAPVGKLLNAAANEVAADVLELCDVGPARAGPTAIHERAIHEAFPSSFLGMMLAEPATVTARRADRSDVYFQHAALSGLFERLMAHLLPGRAAGGEFAAVTNHDDRAGLVCAITALCVAAGRFCAVGDRDGWIVLPPPGFIQPWARELLEKNAAAEREKAFIAFDG